MQWGNFGELVLPFTSLHDDAIDVGYGEAYILEGAWARLNGTVLSLLPGEGRIVGTYGRMYEDVERALHAAPQAVKDSLVLHRVDFDNVQDDPSVLLVGSNEAIAASQAADVAVSQRNFINVLTLGQLRGSNGRLERMARLSMWLGNHITADARADAGFHRRTHILKAAISTKENVPLGLLDDEELAEGLQALLAATSMEPMLMTSGCALGGPALRSEMRAAINM